MLNNPILINSLIISIIASIICGIIGSYIVIKRISYLTGSIAHASFGGIGLGYYFNINPLLSALGFSIISAITMGSIKLKYKTSEDTLISIIWACGMSVGILFIYLTPGYTSDLLTYLFGNILISDQKDIFLLTGLAIGLCVIISIYHNAFQAITFDEEYSQITKLPIYKLWLLFITLLAVAIIILIKVVGIILVIACLTIPAATAWHLTQNLKKMMCLASLLCWLSMISGIAISYSTNLPTSPLIIATCTVFYLVSFMRKRSAIL